MKYAFTKVGMTSAFDSAGNAYGVTLLKLSPAKVLRHDTLEDGRTLVVVTYDIGHKKNIQRGWIVEDSSQFPVGSDLLSPDFTSGQKIKVVGHSKGRGFQDVVTRFGYGGGPKTHGSRFHRSPGSIGMRTEPGRVLKGKRLPGQDGNAQITIRNIKVDSWSGEHALMSVRSGVPGAKGSVVFV